MLGLLTSIYRFSAIPIKILGNYLMDNKRITIEFIWRGQRLKIAKKTLEKKKLEDWCYLTSRLRIKAQ